MAVTMRSDSESVGPFESGSRLALSFHSGHRQQRHHMTGNYRASTSGPYTHATIRLWEQNGHRAKAREWPLMTHRVISRVAFAYCTWRYHPSRFASAPAKIWNPISNAF